VVRSANGVGSAAISRLLIGRLEGGRIGGKRGVLRDWDISGGHLILVGLWVGGLLYGCHVDWLTVWQCASGCFIKKIIIRKRKKFKK
jgi:hypothetical protein